MGLFNRWFGRAETPEKTKTLEQTKTPIYELKTNVSRADLADSLKAESQNLLTLEEEEEYNQLWLEKDTKWLLSWDKEDRFLFLRLKFLWKTEADIYKRIFSNIRKRKESQPEHNWIYINLTEKEENELAMLENSKQELTEEEIDRYCYLVFRELWYDEKTAYTKSVEASTKMQTPQRPKEIQLQIV